MPVSELLVHVRREIKSLYQSINQSTVSFIVKVLIQKEKNSVEPGNMLNDVAHTLTL